jgi:hypothetical protein
MARLSSLSICLAAGLAVLSFSPSSQAVDIKCKCTCRDGVGTWHQSCWSTSSCDTCCGFSGASAELRRRQPDASFIETENGKVAVEARPQAAPTRTR